MPQPDLGGRPVSAVLVVLSTASVIAATLAGVGAPLRAPISLWFVVLCPGLAIIRLARLAGFVPQLVLSVALSIALAGIVATAQLYAGAWSPPATLAILAAIATGAVILDPWLVVPSWESSRLRSIEGRLVPALLILGAAIVASGVLGAGVLIGEWPAGAVASAAAGLAGTAAFAAFVGSRSVTALYAAAILVAAGLPGVVSGGTGAAATTTVTAFGYAMAWAFVASIRAARGGHIGWQLAVAGAFLVASAAAAVVPDLTPSLVPGLHVALAVGLVVRETRQVVPDADAELEPSALGEPSAEPEPARTIPAPDLQALPAPEAEPVSAPLVAAPATALSSDETTREEKRRRPRKQRGQPASDAPRDNAAQDAPVSDTADGGATRSGSPKQGGRKGDRNGGRTRGGPPTA